MYSKYFLLIINPLSLLIESFSYRIVSGRIIFIKYLGYFTYHCVSNRIIFMPNTIYTFSFNPDWMQLTNEISQIDRFDASWTAIEKREGKSLKQLKSIATVRSVGASTRIEGSAMSDEEVKVLIEKLSISKLEDRDSQEVAGYFEALDLISDAYDNMPITETTIKSLHNLLLKHSLKDGWHKGNYKQHNNAVEATRPDGSKYVIFETTPPG